MSNVSIETSVAQFVGAHLDLCGRTQLEVAQMCGLDRPQMISMIKHGRSRIPLDRIRSMARALNVDPLTFGLKVMREYHPELLWIMEGYIQKAMQEPSISHDDSFRLQPATH